MAQPHLIRICHACEFRQAIFDGPCACTISGMDIVHHATLRDCPKGKYDGVTPDSPPPATIDSDMREIIAAPPELWGDKLKVFAEKWGADKLAEVYEKWTGLPCGCSGRREALNKLHRFLKSMIGS